LIFHHATDGAGDHDDVQASFEVARDRALALELGAELDEGRGEAVVGPGSSPPQGLGGERYVEAGAASS
jgi:hypothetical protein